MALRTGQPASNEAAETGPKRGWIGGLALALALYASVMATLAYARKAPGGGGGGAGGDGDELARRLDRQAASVRADVEDDLKKAVSKSEETLGRAEKRLDEARGALKAVVDEGARRSADSAHATAVRAEVLEEKIKEVAQQSGTLKETVDGLAVAVREGGARAPAPGGAAKPTPTPAKPDKPPVEADPVTSGPSAADIAANKDKVHAAMADLTSPDIGKVFNACLVLAKLGDLEAVDAIVKVLKEHKDPYGRVAAANAIGSLHACDGVSGLVQAFLDRDESVVLSAAQGFSKITGQDTGLSGSPSRKDKTDAKEKWGKWWHEHETEVRARWKQPVQAPGAPPVPAPAPAAPPAPGAPPAQDPK